MIRTIRILVLLGLAWFYLHSLWVVQDGFTTTEQPADVAVVLGTTAFIDGSLSPWLQGRVDEALRLYQQRQVKKIMVSGGYYTSSYAEGDAMNYYLQDHGVDSNDIIVDNKGDNTYLTAKNFILLDSTNHFRSAIAVSSYYHLTRTKFIIRKLGYKNVTSSASKAYFLADWWGLTREFVAFYYYLVMY